MQTDWSGRKKEEQRGGIIRCGGRVQLVGFRRLPFPLHFPPRIAPRTGCPPTPGASFDLPSRLTWIRRATGHGSGARASCWSSLSCERAKLNWRSEKPRSVSHFIGAAKRSPPLQSPPSRLDSTCDARRSAGSGCHPNSDRIRSTHLPLCVNETRELDTPEADETADARWIHFDISVDPTQLQGRRPAASVL